MNRFFKKGFSLLEMIVYIAILVFLLVVIINVTITVTRSQKLIKSSRLVQNSALFSLERITREVRLASSVNTVGSTFGVNPGVLSLLSTDASSSPRTVVFSLSNGALHVQENNVDLGPLTEGGTTVTNLVFSLINSSSSQAVRTVMTIESGTSTNYRTQTFYTTTILRGSYAS